jgi:acyl carrier protein
MNDRGDLLPAGETGEVVARGKSLTHGYENNPDANATAFPNGWFHTGDQGMIDSDGYLSLTGRLKEIINQGGEKISPREIDEILLKHSAVAQAVAFAIPHPTLGEAVGVAVVSRDGTTVSEPELRDFALQHLPPFKVPARFAIVPKIPTGPTGKVQRIGLAEKLARELEVQYHPPIGETEQLTASIFENVLHRSSVGRTDNFFALGGDSLRAMQVVARLIENFGIEIPPTILFHRPTPALLAHELNRLKDEQGIALLAAELRRLSPEEAARLLESPFGDDA